MCVCVCVREWVYTTWIRVTAESDARNLYRVYGIMFIAIYILRYYTIISKAFDRD